MFGLEKKHLISLKPCVLLLLLLLLAAKSNLKAIAAALAAVVTVTADAAASHQKKKKKAAATSQLLHNSDKKLPCTHVLNTNIQLKAYHAKSKLKANQTKYTKRYPSLTFVLVKKKTSDKRERELERH